MRFYKIIKGKYFKNSKDAIADVVWSKRRAQARINKENAPVERCPNYEVPSNFSRSNLLEAIAIKLKERSNRKEASKIINKLSATNNEVRNFINSGNR